MNHLYEDELGAVLLGFEVVIILASFEVLRGYFVSMKPRPTYRVDAIQTFKDISGMPRKHLPKHFLVHGETPGETTLRIWTCCQSILRPEAKADTFLIFSPFSIRLLFDIGLLGVEVKDLVHC